MVQAALILILSSALFCFYLQVTVQRILRRKFGREYFLTIVAANRLEFLELARALEGINAPVDPAQLRLSLRRDFLALTYLLKNVANANLCCSREERFLILYFRLVSVSLILRQWLRLRQKPAILKLAAILQYFANVVGQRVSTLRVDELAAAEHLLNL
jgi:hypothetical protein